jgi:hypothetical protein
MIYSLLIARSLHGCSSSRLDSSSPLIRLKPSYLLFSSFLISSILVSSSPCLVEYNLSYPSLYFICLSFLSSHLLYILPFITFTVTIIIITPLLLLPLRGERTKCASLPLISLQCPRHSFLSFLFFSFVLFLFIYFSLI